MINMVIDFWKRLLMKHFKPCGLKYLLLKIKNIICGVVYWQHNSRDVFRNTLKFELKKKKLVLSVQ